MHSEIIVELNHACLNMANYIPILATINLYHTRFTRCSAHVYIGERDKK